MALAVGLPGTARARLASGDPGNIAQGLCSGLGHELELAAVPQVIGQGDGHQGIERNSQVIGIPGGCRLEGLRKAEGGHGSPPAANCADSRGVFWPVLLLGPLGLFPAPIGEKSRALTSI